MAKGNEILVSSPTYGRHMEGTINDTSKPGTCVQLDVSEGFDANGRPDWEAYNTSADGEQRLVAVLLPDTPRGILATTAYASGDRCFVYIPLPGDELNMLVADVAGTGDDHSFGDVMMIDDGTGKLVVTTGTPESEPFVLLEAATDPTADALMHAMFTGY